VVCIGGISGGVGVGGVGVLACVPSGSVDCVGERRAKMIRRICQVLLSPFLLFMFIAMVIASIIEYAVDGKDADTTTDVKDFLRRLK